MLTDLGHRLYAALDAGAWPDLRALVSPRAAVHLASAPPITVDRWLANLAAFHTGFPDGHHVIEEYLVTGAHFVTRCRFEGTHTGPFAGVPPTGRRVSVRALHIDRFTSGRLVEHHGQLDLLGLLDRIGKSD